jgi:hypothetical protein
MSMAGVYVVDFSFDELELRLLDVRTSARRMVRKLRARARERAVRPPAAVGTNDNVGSREEEERGREEHCAMSVGEREARFKRGS